ncbi:glycosyl hydrolase [Opitutaceae bacterium EW11]|nr:glycosyl hydrolase [Opitutaceae bacterium EW11]
MVALSGFLRCIRAWALFGVLTTPLFAALGERSIVTFTATENGIPLVENRSASPIFADANDWPGVVRTARDVQADIERVAGVRPELALSHPHRAKAAVILGTLGKSSLVDELVRSGKVDVSSIQGKWEAWITTTVEQPFPNVDRAVVIIGSDKRGTIYGAYDLSEQIGVSPWYWWADVPPKQHAELWVMPGLVVHPPPAVKYRGIFLNDEAPALSGWANEKFGGLNSRFYAHVFELLLRLRGNYLWPAMWSNAFNEDDPENPRLADEYGIVMGTSHHEPMLRSQQEWHRHGHGAWNYEQNAAGLAEFWSAGVRRNREFESIITLGMRGDGDMAMGETANIQLLERIVHDQRGILAREMKKDVAQVPQLWALYKEVQEYIERGMKVPDDVTLLWCDDNYGNIRRLPSPDERHRSGGAGIYYHLDYVGWPRSYKWLNVTPIFKVWEQMHLAWQYDATRIWIFNVGDLKPMEFPIEFAMRYAWAPADWPYERLTEFGELWAAREFGPEHAKQIAGLIAGYTKLTGAIKPECVSADTFSTVNYDEAKRMLDRWTELESLASTLQSQIAPDARDAYFQLVLWPIRGCSIVYRMSITAGLNRLYTLQGRAETNRTAETVRGLFRADAALTLQFNEELGKGRWRHFADQTHLGYVNWQQPPRNTMPAVSEIQATSYGEIGVAVEGMRPAWPEVIPGQKRPSLPALDSLTRPSRWIEVFNRGKERIAFTVSPSVPWLRVTSAEGELSGAATARIGVSVDWADAPVGATDARLLVKDKRGVFVGIRVPVIKYPADVDPAPGAFLEAEGFVSIEATHFARAVAGDGAEWSVLPSFGRTDGGVTTVPVTAESRMPGPSAAHLEYVVHTDSQGEAKIELTLSPTLAFTPRRGLRYAISVDDEPPQLVDLQIPVGDGREAWGQTVLEGVRKTSTKHKIARPGAHVIKFWRVDPGVVLQRLLLSFGDVRTSYYGPPESPRR